GGAAPYKSRVRVWWELPAAFPAVPGCLGVGRSQVGGPAVAAARGQALLEAAETSGHAALGIVIELEMARACRDGQHLRNDVEIQRGKECSLLGLAHRVLVERCVLSLDTRIPYGGIRRGAD